MNDLFSDKGSLIQKENSKEFTSERRKLNLAEKVKGFGTTN